MLFKQIALACATVMAASATPAADQTLNIYSARHYPTDEALYANFTKATGIRINRVDSDDAGILARLKAEGTASPADVILLVDAARLWKGEIEGLFQPIKSKPLDDAIPQQLRGKGATEGGTPWFGFSTRARIVVFDKATVQKTDVDSYEALAEPKNKGRLCIRSGSHPYNLSLFGSKGWSTTWRAAPRAATPTRSRPWLQENAPSPSPTPTIWRASCALTSRRIRQPWPGSALFSPTNPAGAPT
jgi:iron(III) transport system substrate-binding protein